MIITDDSTLQEELYTFTKTLLARKYPLNLINKNINKALQFNQEELINKAKPKNTHNHQAIIFTTKYTTLGKTTSNNIKNNWEIIETDTYTSNIFPELPIAAFKKLTSIGNILIRSDTTP